MTNNCCNISSIFGKGIEGWERTIIGGSWCATATIVTSLYHMLCPTTSDGIEMPPISPPLDEPGMTRDQLNAFDYENMSLKEFQAIIPLDQTERLNLLRSDAITLVVRKFFPQAPEYYKCNDMHKWIGRVQLNAIPINVAERLLLSHGDIPTKLAALLPKNFDVIEKCILHFAWIPDNHINDVNYATIGMEQFHELFDHSEKLAKLNGPNFKVALRRNLIAYHEIPVCHFNNVNYDTLTISNFEILMGNNMFLESLSVDNFNIVYNRFFQFNYGVLHCIPPNHLTHLPYKTLSHRHVTNLFPVDQPERLAVLTGHQVLDIFPHLHYMLVKTITEEQKQHQPLVDRLKEFVDVGFYPLHL